MARKDNRAMQLGYLVRLILQASNACSPAAGMASTQIAPELHMVYNNCRMIIEATRGREKGNAQQPQ